MKYFKMISIDNKISLSRMEENDRIEQSFIKSYESLGFKVYEITKEEHDFILYTNQRLVKQLKEMVQNAFPKAKILNSKGWMPDIIVDGKNISIRISSSSSDCSMSDSRDNDDFYEFYLYRGCDLDIRNNKFIDRFYSEPISDLNKALIVISEIINSGK